jgi:DNA-binding MarR family transcriptional regulator
VLGHLHRDGALTPSALAQAEAVQPQSLTRLLADLEAAGLALRRQDPRDGRQYLIGITPEGRETLRRDAQAQAAWLARAMEAQLTAAEQGVLRLAAGLMDRLAELPASPRAVDSNGDAPDAAAWPE